MKKQVTQKIAEQMILGSSIYSTGGGIEYNTQKKLFGQLFKKTNHVDLLSIDELKDDDYVCTAYAVGSAGNTDFDLTPLLQLGLQALEQYTHKKFTAIFGGETNADIIAFQAATNVGLPVLDADSNGGRAVPEIQHDNFVIAGQSITPAVAVTPDRRVAILAQAPDAFALEKFVRGLSATIDKGLIAVMDHPIQVKEAKKILTLGIFSRSIALGEYIENNKSNSEAIKTIVSMTGGKQLIQGTVKKVETDHNSLQGFLNGYYYVEDDKKNVLKVFVKNENIIAWFNNKLIITSPDSILTLDTETFLGVHNSKIHQGQKVLVIGKPATPLWKTQKGRDLFAPKRFGIEESSVDFDL